jgi:SAM-dependent methyltransferase
MQFMRGNIQAHGGSKLPHSSFDVILLINTLFTAADREMLAHEMARVLKRGGHGLVVDWRDSFGGLGPHPEHVMGIGAARDVFEAANLAYVADVPAGDYHWGFLVRKM